MQVYLGQTRSTNLIQSLNAMGWREMTVRGELPPKRTPWAFDNGAFRDWKNGIKFNAAKFRQDLKTIRSMETKPDFIVIPDIVGAGEQSFEFSWEWLGELHMTAPLYLAVQDGMDANHVEEIRDYITGILVGGTLTWKLKMGKMWTDIAHRYGLACHMGRAGTTNRVRWCERIGVDSIDSCLPLWSAENMARFMRGFEDVAQMELAAT